MERKKDSEKKKRVLRYGKLYIISCVVCLVLGLTSFGIAHNISRSVIKTGEREIKIPSYEEIIKENEEKNPKIEKIKDRYEKKGENAVIINDEEAVNVINLTENKSEKGVSFTAPCNGKLIKRFSIDKPLKSETMGDFRTHNGVDIKTEESQDVFTAADGVIENVFDDDFFGKTILISHGENFKTQYSNLAENVYVKKGDEVKEGDVIGKVGKSAKGELLDDSHLHFSMLLNGEYVDPHNYIVIGENKEDF